MSNIYVNMVLQVAPLNEKDKTKSLRIIWINEDNTFCYYVNLEGECPLPKWKIVSKLKDEIESGHLFEVSDPFAMVIDEKSIPDKYREIRDSNWKIVDFLWNSETKDVLVKEKRMKFIKEAAEKFNTYEKRIIRIISRFWQRGMNKNALLPDYSNSAAKGQEKGDNGIKRGRPRKPSYFGEVPEGTNITEEIKSKIRMSIDLFYRKKQKKSVVETYTHMLERFFSDKYFKDGKEEIIVWNKDKIPTFDQFYYWFKKDKDFKNDYTFRNSEREFQLKYRELIGNSTMETFGPGSRYQIDATPADVYLLSSINRDKVIGRPVVYAVIDVYSRLVVGIYVGLEGPSWIGAMMALDNVVGNKIEFCKNYGIEISEDDWPESYLPETIIADRGEFEGYNVENLINNLNVKIENTAPYRGDLKGIVERYFRTTNEKIKHTTPGAIQKEYRVRGDLDYRLRATLNLREFTAIIIYQVLRHNKNILDRYPRERGLLEDEVAAIPIDIWKWGLKNRPCGFIKRDCDTVRLNILPKAKASISREGIKFKRMFYSCEKAMEEQWFINPEKRSVEFVYDPRNMNYIYIPYNRGKDFYRCFLLEKSFMYKDLQLEEVVFQLELEYEQLEGQKVKQLQNDIELEHNIKNIIKNAEDRQKNQVHTSNSRRIKGIKENRLVEKELNRQSEHFVLGETDRIQEPAKIVDFAGADISIKSEKENGKSNSKLALLKKIRDEKLGK